MVWYEDAILPLKNIGTDFWENHFLVIVGVALTLEELSLAHHHGVRYNNKDLRMR